MSSSPLGEVISDVARTGKGTRAEPYEIPRDPAGRSLIAWLKTAPGVRFGRP